MSITMDERPDSPTRSSESSRRSYNVEGSTDIAAIYSHVESNAPASDAGFTQRTISVSPNSTAANSWIATVNYRAPDSSTPTGSTSTFAFQVAGQRERVTHALSKVNSYAPPTETAPDFGTAINVTDQGIQGVEIEFATLAYEERHEVANSAVNASLIGGVFDLFNKTNNATWKYFDAGEALFKGADFNRRPDGLWEVTYRFIASPNATGLSVGSITGIDKKGHELLWVHSREEVVSDQLVTVPKGVYVMQVYESGDFSTLGIGT